MFIEYKYRFLHFDRKSVMQELNENGYTVIPDVCSEHDCDVYMSQYHDWLSQFGTERPSNRHSVVLGYNTGQLETTWRARLQAKPVFAAIWQTEKLLTSIDRIAISYPPGVEVSYDFNKGDYWYHFDHSCLRLGLHGYQGALYLEEATEKDRCFRVVSGSHRYQETFYEESEESARESVVLNQGYILKEKDLTWFQEKGCFPTKVPVPKGGMVLWDTRTAHDNCKPERDRPHSERCRFVVFVSMTPAQWARPEDMEVKKDVYRNLRMTGHWPSQGIEVLNDVTPKHSNKVEIPCELPEVAQTKEVRLLTGDLEYDFSDGRPNGPAFKPVWKDRPKSWHTSDI